MTAANILTHLANLEPRYCNFLLNCPPTTNGTLDQHIIDTITKVGNSWTPEHEPDASAHATSCH